jgi:hypothetical protein
MSVYLVFTLFVLAVIFAVMIGTTVKSIHDQMRDEAQEGFSDERL